MAKLLSTLNSCRVTLLVAGLVLCSLAGCSSFSPMNQKPLPTDSNANSTGQFAIELHQAFGNPQILRGTVTDKTTVQSAIEEYGATEKYRTMEITLVRRVGDSPRLLKMPCDYDTRTNQIRLEQDYAIHANDRLVIKPKSNSVLDKMVDSLMGSF